MPTLQYIIRCAAGRSTCVTVYKCCCFDDLGNPVPASGAPVTIKLGDTTIASGTADSDGQFCFRPCIGGAYTLILGVQDVCSDSSTRWDIGICGDPSISTTQATTPGYYCCNGIQVPVQVMITDNNGSWPGFMVIGASAFAPSLAHAGDTITNQQIGYMDVTSSEPLVCLLPTGGACTPSSPWYAAVNAALFNSAAGPFSYSYGLTCGKDETGVYLELSLAWAFHAENSNDFIFNGITCCYNGFFYEPFDCVTGFPDLGAIDYEPGPYGLPCLPSPFPPCGPCKTHVWYGGPDSYVATSVIPRVYLGGPSCTREPGPWSFTVLPGPTVGYGIPTWQLEIPVDCEPDSFGKGTMGSIDHTIAPPPPGGTSITVSGYFP